MAVEFLVAFHSRVTARQRVTANQWGLLWHYMILAFLRKPDRGWKVEGYEPNWMRWDVMMCDKVRQDVTWVWAWWVWCLGMWSLLTKGLHWQMMMWVFWQVVQFQAILESAEDEYMFWHHLSWMTGKYKIWSNRWGLSSTEEPIQILNQGLLPAFRGREIWLERGTHGQGTLWSRRVPISRNTYPSGHMTHLGLSMMEVKHQYCHDNREGAHGHDRLEIYTWNHRRKPGQP